MLPDNPDILFSGSVSTNGNPEEDLVLSAEVDHLTCFIGGMVGMGARVFGNDGDLEIAKKLADGCVWAYGATSSGIMPEGASVYPCRSAEHCTWNETAYWEFLDPMGPTRDRHAEEYLIAKAHREEEAEIAAFAAGERAEAERMNAEDEANMISAASDEDIEAAFNTTDPAKGTASLKNEKPISLEKRQSQSSPKEEVPKPITHNFQDDLPKVKTESSNSQAQTGAAKASQQKSQHTEAELKDMATSGRQADSPLSEVTPQGTGSQTPLLPDPLKPLTHKEYVEARIKQEGLPPGFVSLRSKKYILR
jgi:mannosyl-oligosaccharide alpha-1,2-mannosidase